MGFYKSLMTAYLFDNPAYPIVTRKQDIVPALHDPFCRAVTVRIPELAFDSSGISAAVEPDLAKLYWRDEHHVRKRRASGDRNQDTPLTTRDVAHEIQEAKIKIDPATLIEFTSRCNIYRRIFTKAFEEYTGLRDIPHRDYTLFTPLGGQGRSPELHVDNTILTLHWSAALAKFSICNAQPDEATWAALDRKNQSAMTPEERARNFQFLVDAASNSALDIRDNRIDDMIITKGQRGLDLSDPVVRNGVCVHVSSKTIVQYGQAGFLMTPKMPAIV